MNKYAVLGLLLIGFSVYNFYLSLSWYTSLSTRKTAENIICLSSDNKDFCIRQNHTKIESLADELKNNPIHNLTKISSKINTITYLIHGILFFILGSLLCISIAYFPKKSDLLYKISTASIPILWLINWLIRNYSSKLIFLFI